MDLVSINNTVNLKQQNITNSLVFYLFHKNDKENKYLKSTNKIQGFYYDSILKENIYISSNGLKKTASFKKVELNKNIFNSHSNIFVSYFTILEDNLFKFNLYPKKYYKTSSFKFLSNQNLIQTSLNCQQTINKKRNFKIFFKNSLNVSNTKFHTFFGFVDKLVMIQSYWKKIYVSTNRGICLNYSRKFDDRSLFTGLTNIYDEKAKDSFKLLLMLNYLLIKFAGNLNFAWKKNKNLLATTVIYFLYRAQASFNFFSHHFGRRLRFRRNNYLLKRYNKSLRYAAGRFTRYFFKISLKKYKYHLKNNYWIGELFNKDRKIFLTKNISQNVLITQKLNTLDTTEKINLLKYLLNYFKYQFVTRTVGYNNKFALFIKIEFLKSLIFKSIKENINFYNFKNVIDNTQRLLFNRANALDNSLYTTESNFVFTKRFRHDSSISNKKIKIYTKTMNLFLGHPLMLGKNRRKKGKPLITNNYEYIQSYLTRFAPRRRRYSCTRLIRTLKRLRVRFNSKRVRRLNKVVYCYINNIMNKTNARTKIVLIPKTPYKRKRRLYSKIKY